VSPGSPTPPYLRLGVNIDHVATIRNARGGPHPDPLRAAELAAEAGADGITAHLREDRRHIGDGDIAKLRDRISLPLNLEMAVTEEMLAIALKHVPHAACLVPERRQEVTTEGGLDVAGGIAAIGPVIARLADAGIKVSVFIDAEERQIDAAAAAGAAVVELHTGAYCQAQRSTDQALFRRELDRLKAGAAAADAAGLEVHAGHGLSFESVGHIAAIGELVELNIGHFLVGEAIFSGLDSAIRRMRSLMDHARATAHGRDTA
jgi:pyridoxine 5-phosphate synthase